MLINNAYYRTLRSLLPRPVDRPTASNYSDVASIPTPLGDIVDETTPVPAGAVAPPEVLGRLARRARTRLARRRRLRRRSRAAAGRGGAGAVELRVPNADRPVPGRKSCRPHPPGSSPTGDSRREPLPPVQLDRRPDRSPGVQHP